MYKKNKKFFLLIGVIASMLAIISCEEADSGKAIGNQIVYMPQAAFAHGGVENGYQVPLEGSPTIQNYGIDLDKNTLEIYLGAYHSGTGFSSSATVNVITDENYVNQLIADGIIPNAILLPSDVYALPDKATISEGKQLGKFNLSIDLLKLNEDYGDLLGKKLVLAVGLEGTSNIELNESLSTTVIMIDSEEFMPQIYMPQASEDGIFSENGIFINSGSQDYVFDDIAKTLDVKLGVDCPGLLYKGAYSVDIITHQDIVNQWIADEVVSNAVMLPSDVYTLPDNVSVLDGESSVDFNLAIDVQKLIDNYPELGGKKLLVAVGLDNPSEYSLNESQSTTMVIINSRDFMPAPPLMNLLLGGAMETESTQYWNWINQGEIWGYTDDGPAGGEGGCMLWVSSGNKNIWTSFETEIGKTYQFSAKMKVGEGANFWCNFRLFPSTVVGNCCGNNDTNFISVNGDAAGKDGDIRDIGSAGGTGLFGNGHSSGTNGLFTATSTTTYLLINVGRGAANSYGSGPGLLIDEIWVTEF